MKNIITPILLSVILFSCNQKADTSNNKIQETSPNTVVDKEEISPKKKIIDSIWIEDFKQFRQALYQDDYESLENFIQFPLTYNTWYLVYGENSTEDYFEKDMNRDDFHKYYKKIFPQPFIKSLLSVRSEELYYREEVFSSKPTLIDRDLYKVVVCHDEKSDNVMIGLGQESLDIPKPVDKNPLGCNYISLQYTFTIDSSSHLKFVGINMAG